MCGAAPCLRIMARRLGAGVLGVPSPTCPSCWRRCRPPGPFLHACPFWPSSTLAFRGPPLHLGPFAPLLKAWAEGGGGGLHARCCAMPLVATKLKAYILHVPCSILALPLTRCQSYMSFFLIDLAPCFTLPQVQSNGHDQRPQMCSLHCAMSPRHLSTPLLFHFRFY